MKKITDVITLSELSRLINISRPTLYKYIDSYENDRKEEIPDKFIALFDFITSDSCTDKEKIYEYSISSYEAKSDKGMMDRIKFLLEDERYQELFSLIVNNTDKIDIEELILLIERRLK